MAEVHETEEQLIERAQRALSRCNWEIGECAAAWTSRYARGRTDADFGALIGLSGDQVYQRRRVWETFSDVYKRYSRLKWSHFYAALNWDDAAGCLQWADEMSATVAEMKAWRRAQRGEDLTTASEDAAVIPDSLELLPVSAAEVREPGSGTNGSGSRRPSGTRNPEPAKVTGAAREADASGDDYAPFGARARGSAEDAESRPAPGAEQVLKRIVASLERCNAALTPDVLEACAQAPVSLQTRLRSAIDDLHAKTRRVGGW